MGFVVVLVVIFRGVCVIILSVVQCRACGGVGSDIEVFFIFILHILRYHINVPVSYSVGTVRAYSINIPGTVRMLYSMIYLTRYCTVQFPTR